MKEIQTHFRTHFKQKRESTFKRVDYRSFRKNVMKACSLEKTVAMSRKA